MKKILTVLFLSVAMIGGSAVSVNAGISDATPRKATTAKKKTGRTGAATKARPAVQSIGSFKADGRTVTLLANGKIKATDKCTDGEYTKKPGYIQVQLWSKASPYCGDGGEQYVIVDNKVYYLFAGSDNCLCNYTVDVEKKTLTKVDFDEEWDPETIGMTSATVPLTFFEVISDYVPR